MFLKCPRRQFKTKINKKLNVSYFHIISTIEFLAMESKIYFFDQTKFSFFLNKTPKATIAFQNFLISYFEKFLFYKNFKMSITKSGKKIIQILKNCSLCYN